jgi:putative transposase
MAIITKYRNEWLNEGIFVYLKNKLVEISKHSPLINLKTVNYDQKQPDRNQLVSISPTMSVRSIVRIIKNNTSRTLKQRFSFFIQLYWGTGDIWSDNYFISTIGVNKQMIRQYIKNQGKEDSGQALLEFL